MNELLKWSNLTINRCPKCNADFANAHYDSIKKLIICGKCDFSITELRMRVIVTERVKIDEVGKDEK